MTRRATNAGSLLPKAAKPLKIAPFLKWPGGKRWLADKIVAAFPRQFSRYIEPFLGGGAVFFQLRPREAILADTNKELVETYTHVKDNVEDVIKRLDRLVISRDMFYRLRGLRPDSAMERVVRFIYLNKTAFNGMYRVNQQGEFNVPFGCKAGTVLCDARCLRLASLALRSCEILCCDFEELMLRAGPGDLVYADPPYTVKHDNNGFRRYNESLFSWDDQERLGRAARAAVRRGATVVVSNAHHPEISSLYPGFRAHEFKRTSCVSGKVSARQNVREYLFVMGPQL